MSKVLVPCERCHRHLRASATSCPFCGAAHAPVTAEPRVVQARVSRAVLLTLGASLSLAGCGGGSVALYGAPVPPDAAADAQPSDAGADAQPADVAADAQPSDAKPTDVPDAQADVGVRYGAPPAVWA